MGPSSPSSDASDPGTDVDDASVRAVRHMHLEVVQRSRSARFPEWEERKSLRRQLSLAMLAQPSNRVRYFLAAFGEDTHIA